VDFIVPRGQQAITSRSEPSSSALASLRWCGRSSAPTARTNRQKPRYVGANGSPRFFSVIDWGAFP